ncbi:MAG: hypothetical protein K2L67_06900 [Clostridia bacterium]|nr:hypothetical protein [Clostridia bacterium]
MKEKIYKCNDCPTQAEFKNDDEARKAGWGFSKGRKKHYCPIHAPLHRHTGGKLVPTFNSGKQLKIESL